MCAICGIISSNIDETILYNMAYSMKHRGPDNIGKKIYHKNNCGLAHARLSIIDLSTSANQPMEYKDYSVVFNGEIYNYKEIKVDLQKKGHTFCLESDTEIILHAFEQWGVDCVNRFIGMFAFAILDKVNNKLYLFRDRTGVKPLYYYYSNDLLLFSSELKSFFNHPGFERRINRESVGLYFKQGNIPAPYSIYEKCFKLLPGYYMEYDISKRTFELHQYWNVLDYYKMSRLELEYNDAKNILKGLLISSCNYRMLADVPVGIFLSGGYDSAGVTAILQSERTEKLKTFTIGFEEGNNEADAARDIAKFIGTEHHEYICKEKDAIDIVPSLCEFYDEPFADSSAIPTMLVSRFAKKYVTVALSADGGDESFYGYNSYLSMARYIDKLNKIMSLNGRTIKPFVKCCSMLFNEFSLYRSKLYCIHEVLSHDVSKNVSVLFDSMQSLHKDIFNSFLNVNYPIVNFLDNSVFSNGIDLVAYMDYVNYLPNDVLTKVDRATMAVSLEGREPLLDHRIIEFMAQLPMSYKFEGGILKRIYKDIVHEYIPYELMNRPKTGFSIPINSWLKKDLSYLLNDFISENDIDESLLKKRKIIQLKKDFLSTHKLDNTSLIWKILVFQMWYKRWIN